MLPRRWITIWAANWFGPGRRRKSTRPGANGVVELSPFEFLERLADLSLAETSLTDDAVAVLERFGSLRMLVLLRTGVSDAGVARLRKALPEAKIMIESPGARRRQWSPRP